MYQIMFLNIFCRYKLTSQRHLNENQGVFYYNGFLSLTSFLEEKFQIQTSDDDLIEENFESINAIVQYIGRKLESN